MTLNVVQPLTAYSVPCSSVFHLPATRRLQLPSDLDSTAVRLLIKGC